jgi:ribonuclease BN (tRNA processing enzyme)
LRNHLFNNVLWPDFTCLPTREKAIIHLKTFALGDQIALDGLCIEVLPALHTVPACGFAVDSPSGWWVYTGDTAPNEALWSALGSRRIAQFVIETAFSNEEYPVALASKHMAPSMLAGELNRLPHEVPVAITHVKPGEQTAVSTQIAALDLPHRIHALAGGECYRF